MYLNISFLGVTYIIGKSVDYILQMQSQAENKTKDIQTLATHSFIYSSWTTSLVTVILNITDIAIILSIVWVLFFTHVLIDKRDIVKFIMHCKGIKYEEMNTKYGWLQIEIDQRLHELVILALALVI